jgi:hypothetical protein
MLLANNSHVVVFSNSIRNFHSNERASDDNNLLVLVSNGPEDSLDVRDSAEQENIGKLFETRKRKTFGSASRCQN